MKANSLSSFRAALCASAFAVWFPGCLPDGSSPELPILGAGEGGGSGTAAGSGAGTGAGGTTAGAAGRGTTTGAAGASGMASSTGAAGRAMPAAGGGAGGARAGAGGAGMGAAGRSGAGGGAAGAAGAMGMAGRMAAGAGGAGGAGGRGGMGGGGGAAGGGMAGAAGGGMAATTTFTQVYGLIMTGCGCHVSGTSGGLSMANKMSAFTNLVGANSTACSGQKRVVANDPANSVFFHSIERTMLGSCNVPQMPAGGAGKWSQADIDKVKAWIMAGAMNN